jgi:hypothetical protein
MLVSGKSAFSRPSATKPSARIPKRLRACAAQNAATTKGVLAATSGASTAGGPLDVAAEFETHG